MAENVLVGSLRAPSVLPRKYQAFTRANLDAIPGIARLSPADRDAIRAISAVLPFRVNSYVAEALIDWDDIPNDPIYQLTFPQREMLEADEFDRLYSMVRNEAPAKELREAARTIQDRMNPHPAGQLELNAAKVDDERVEGMQHKYRETVLFFPAAGQTCHAYCTYCFRWAQFVGIDELKMAAKQVEPLVSYLREHREVDSVLVTGGDPMVMKASVLRRYIEPLLADDLDHITNIRFGTKAPAYWPYRFITDPDAGELLGLFEKIVESGRHVALMAHFSHPRELETPAAEEAIRRIQSTGAVVRCQAPLIRHVNDSSELWATMWRKQVALGAVPYYMFVERDTGPKRYFELPLARALKIYNDAYRRLPGLARTARGPSMSATPGKVVVDDITRIDGRDYFALKFLQARDPDWCGRIFFAEYDEEASWLDDLRPAFGEERFFFER